VVLPTYHARVAAGSVLQSVARGLALGAGVILAGYLTRRLGIADYGSYAVAIALTTWFSAVLTTATTAGSIRIMAAHQDGRRFAVTMLAAALGAGTSLCLVAVLVAPLISAALRTPALASLLQISAVDIPLTAMASVYNGLLTGQGRFAIGAGSFVATAVARLALAVVFLQSGFGVVGAALSVPLASLVQVLYGWTATGVSPFERERVRLSELWEQTRLMAGASLALRVSQRLDLLAVKIFVASPAVTGLYAGAQNLAHGPMLAFQGSPGVMTQAVARARARGEHDVAVDLVRTFLRTTMAYAGLIIAMAGLAGDAVVFVLGGQFAQAGPVLAVLLWSAAFRVLSNGARGVIAAIGEQTVLVRLLVLAIAGGAILYAVLVPLAGGVGAALGAAILATVIFTLSAHAITRLLQMTFPWRSLMRVATASLASGAAAAALPGIGPLVMLRAIGVAVIYGALIWMLGEWRPRRADASSFFQSLRVEVSPRG
jgi:O-antigen/teichoic acid export membrane protein